MASTKWVVAWNQYIKNPGHSTGLSSPLNVSGKISLAHQENHNKFKKKKKKTISPTIHEEGMCEEAVLENEVPSCVFFIDTVH